MTRRAKRIATLVSACAGIGLLVGCESSGLSTREAGSFSSNYASGSAYGAPASLRSAPFSQYVHTLSDKPATKEPVKMVAPAAVAVSQVGEVSPPSKMLSRLREGKDVLSRVEIVPWPSGLPANTEGDLAAEQQEQARRQMDHAVTMAAGMGVDYLLVFGGTIDQESNYTALTPLDITVVGAFVVPSRKLDTKAVASAALVDVRARTVVLTASADATNWALVPSANVSGESTLRKEDIREQVVNKLATQILEQWKTRMKVQAGPIQ
jgi:hypothetical protein